MLRFSLLGPQKDDWFRFFCKLVVVLFATNSVGKANTSPSFPPPPMFSNHGPHGPPLKPEEATREKPAILSPDHTTAHNDRRVTISSSTASFYLTITMTVEMKRVLVFGGKTGWIGQTMVEMIRKEGANRCSQLRYSPV